MRSLKLQLRIGNGKKQTFYELSTSLLYVIQYFEYYILLNFNIKTVSYSSYSILSTCKNSRYDKDTIEVFQIRASKLALCFNTLPQFISSFLMAYKMSTLISSSNRHNSKTPNKRLVKRLRNGSNKGLFSENLVEKIIF